MVREVPQGLEVLLQWTIVNLSGTSWVMPSVEKDVPLK
jgi:hypothetical protein